MDGNVDYDPFLGDAADPTGVDETKAAAAESESTAPSPEALRVGELALNLRDNAAAGWLYMVTNSTLGEQIGPDAFLVFRKLMLEEAGDPADPIERMLIEQLALSHFSIGQLRIRSCTTSLPKMALAFSDSATRLLGEFRRCALALEEYRGKRAARTEKRDRTAREPSTAPPTPAKVNGRALLSVNGNGKHQTTKLGSNGNARQDVTNFNENHHGDLPAWIKERMRFPALDGYKRDGVIAANGEG